MIARRGFLLLAMALVVRAHAAELTATIETGNLRLRRGGPIPLEVRFHNPTPRLIEGRLEVTLLLGDRRAGVQRGAELVIEPGARTVPVLLSPPADAHPGDGIAARIRWIGAEGTRDLGTQQIGIYGFGGNEFVLGIVRTERRLTDFDHTREASLSVESLRPKLDAASWLTFTTLTAPIASTSLPAHPIAWCAYDAVFLDGPAFAAASEKQLAVLTRWIEAGGSLWICADTPVQERHLAFLDALCAKHGTKKRFTSGDGGRVDMPGRKPFVLRPGIGTAVIVTHATDGKDLAGKPWRAAVAAFWKLPLDQVREIAANGVWDKDWTNQSRWLSEQGDGELRSLWLATSGLDALRPDAPRLMPLVLVSGTLAVLLLCVGPGDYLLLGWLRRRRWTWLLFPAFCALCAWWMWRAAERSIGTDDRRGTVRLVDVARDGRVLREVRYEFLLPARDREWELPMQDAMAVTMPRAEQEADTRLGIPNPGIASGTSSDATFEWESISSGRMKRSLRQWTPALVRITTFPTDARDDSGTPWDALEARNARFQYNEEFQNVIEREPVSTPPGMQCWSHSPEWGALPSILDYRSLHRIGTGASVRTFRTGLRTTAWIGRAPGAAGTLQRTMEDDNSRGSDFLLAWRQEGKVTTIYRRFSAPPEP